MTLVSLERIEKSFAGEPVLDGVSLRVDEKERLGVVGDNGAGKTTLIEILAGISEADRGQRNPRRDLRVAYLRQIPALVPGVTVREWVLRGDGAMGALESRIRSLETQLAAAPHGPRLLDEYGHAQTAFEAGGGYRREHLCEQVLAGLGFAAADLTKDVAVLSGGEKSRVALAALITSPADLLILDEPTNHLDLDGIEFLESFVRDYPGTVVAVSHDRTFLDAVAKAIVEVEGGRVTRWPGNWSAYTQQRDLALLALARSFKSQADFVAKEMDYIRRNMAGQNSTQAKGRLKRLQRLERIARPRGGGKQPLRLRFTGGEGFAGQAIVECEDLSVRVGDRPPLFQHATFKLFFGEVLGVLGRNGAGKTTLLRVLAGQLAPSAGSLQVAAGTRFGFFTQEMSDLPASGTVLEALRVLDVQATEQELRDHLGLFWFTGDDVERPVANLSGGEKRRLCLARLTRSSQDVLLLDEPTNHLDIATREGFEQAVLQFPGSTVVVSHDRRFLETVADRVLYVADGKVRMFDRGLEQCLERLTAERRAAVIEARPKDKPAIPAAERPKPSGTRIRNPHQFEKLEERIMVLEAELAALRGQMTEPDNYQSQSRMKELFQREQELKQELAESYERWENW